MKKEVKGSDKFTQGFVCAVVTLIQLNKEVDVRTRELFNAGVGNMTLSGLKGCGVDGYDLEMLTKYWDELNK